jgi:hypothetical protein
MPNKHVLYFETRLANFLAKFMQEKVSLNILPVLKFCCKNFMMVFLSFFGKYCLEFFLENLTRTIYAFPIHL